MWLKSLCKIKSPRLICCHGPGDNPGSAGNRSGLWDNLKERRILTSMSTIPPGEALMRARGFTPLRDDSFLFHWEKREHWNISISVSYLSHHKGRGLFHKEYRQNRALIAKKSWYILSLWGWKSTSYLHFPKASFSHLLNEMFPLSGSGKPTPPAPSRSPRPLRGLHCAWVTSA